MNRFTPTLSALFGSRNNQSLRCVPTHLLADCGFEAAEGARVVNQEIDRLTLKLSSLR